MTTTDTDTDRKVTTPVITFESPAGRTVTLIGIVHVGTAQYYVQIQQRIAALEDEGARVHVERVLTNTAGELKAATRSERRAVRALTQQLQSGPDMVGHVYGFAHQRCLPYPSRWEIHDLDKLAVVRLWGPRAVRKAGWAAKALLRYFRSEVPGVQRRILIAGCSLKEGTPLEQVMPPARAAVEKRREEVALEAVDAAFAGGDVQHVVLLWGRGHVPGLSAGLAARRFEAVAEDRLTAFDLRYLPDLTDADARAGVKETTVLLRSRARILGKLETPDTPR